MAKNDSEDSYNLGVGKRIVKAQKRAGLTDFEAAGASGMDTRDYKAYASGSRGLKAIRLARIAKALRVPSDYLLGLDVAAPGQNQ